MTDRGPQPHQMRASYEKMAQRAQYEWERAEQAEAEAQTIHSENEALKAALRHVLINLGEEGFIPRTEAIKKYVHLIKEVGNE